MAMNANELRDKTPDELRAELVILKKSNLICVFKKQRVRLNLLLE